MARSVSAPRRRSRRRRASRRLRLNDPTLFLRAGGVLAVAVALAFVPWASVGGVLGAAQHGLVRAAGLWVLIAAGWLVGGGVAVAAGWRWPTGGRGRRVLLVLFLATLCLWGVLGLQRPIVRFGGVPLDEHTAGGSAGQWLASWPGTLLWLGLFAATIYAAAPRATRTAVRRAPRWLAHAWAVAWSAIVPPLRAYGERRRLEHQAQLEAPPRPVPWIEIPPPADEPLPEEAPDLPAAAARAFRRGAPERLPIPEVATVEPPAPLAPLSRAMHHDEATGWALPPLDLLIPGNEAEVLQGDNQARARLIEQTLGSFGVDARVVQINQGPTVTQFGVEPGWEVKTRTVVERDGRGRPVLEKDGQSKTRVEEVSRTRVRVNDIVRLQNDLALALAAPSIRIEAPVPGKPVVGIEVPNAIASVVTLRSVIETPQFQKLSARGKLALALGKSVSGEAIVADLAKMPHLLIAGATGSGKSVCINSIIACLLVHASPEEVRLVMIDPKRVELKAFERLPHLALSRLITEVDEVPGTLQAVLNEMDQRYKRFAAIGVRNIEVYNRSPRVPAKMPYWIVIIDELADLMMSAAYEVERQICRLAQLARATGIHLVVATQRPSVDVVTGLIKANFPTRIAFSVQSQVDSRTILDATGAEKLLGRGDMLFQPVDEPKPKRVQGVFVSDAEIDRLVGFWTSERFTGLEVERFDHLLDEARDAAAADDAPDMGDPLYERALEVAREHTRISASLLQRYLRIGYPRAARLIDLLEAEGAVGPPEGSGSREVLLVSSDGEAG